ncbi:MAG: 1-acyl-sn-glycerol-3-phosphate acyltransferase [Clostridia bacterium]|nr:1-acyl-sn-glycerol-3-phosphate acyltransferase [Clostridia bacterium]
MQSEYRLKVLEKIKEYENKELWDKDVEDDPETIVLMPDKVDYLGEKLSSKIMTFIANRLAVYFYEKKIRTGEFIIKEINGLENYRKVNGGAIITCNHFSVYDNYAIYRAIRKDLPKGHQLYKVIREGNYTNFKGFFGFLFKHCNVLPLSSNTQTMKNFLSAVDTLLTRGEKILIYPEQAMWWNYRKPRPFKSGAFRFATKSKVPVIPAFITMEDTDKLDGDGFKIQAYTIWFLPPIYPKDDLSDKQNAEYLKEENYKALVNLYEKVYDKPLVYGEE